MVRFAFLFLVAVLTGCVAPVVQEPRSETAIKPEPPLPADLPTAWKHATAKDIALPVPWWNGLNAPALNDLITTALMDNPDIRIAEARLSQTRSIVAEADDDELVTGNALLSAAESDTHAIRLAVSHAVTTAYADARLAEAREVLLQQRLLLARDLTKRLNKKLAAGLSASRTLREAEQSEIEIRQASTRNRHALSQATHRLALLSGVAPIEFKWPLDHDVSATDFFSGRLSLPADLPSAVIERRPDVQAAWQHLLAAIDADKNDDNLPLAAQIEQAEAAPSLRDALYRKAVLAALNDVETALVSWHQAHRELKISLDALDIQTGNLRDAERELASGRISQVEVLKAQLAENIAQENVLLARYAQRIAFATAQLALARD